MYCTDPRMTLTQLIAGAIRWHVFAQLVGSLVSELPKTGKSTHTPVMKQVPRRLAKLRIFMSECLNAPSWIALSMLISCSAPGLLDSQCAMKQNSELLSRGYQQASVRLAWTLSPAKQRISPHQAISMHAKAQVSRALVHFFKRSSRGKFPLKHLDQYWSIMLNFLSNFTSTNTHTSPNWWPIW